MSVWPPPLSPQWAPPARKPGASRAGSSPSTPAGGSTQRDLKNPSLTAHTPSGALYAPTGCKRRTGTSLEALRLIEAQHQVEVLHALPGGALPEVVDRREGQHPAPLLDGDVDVALVGVAHVAQAGRAVDDADEGLAGVALAVERLHLILGDRLAGLRVAAGQLTLVERQQVRDEGDRRWRSQCRQLLFDLGPVPMPLSLVGEGVLVHRDVAHRVAAAAAGTGDALLGVDDDVGQQAALGERRQGQHAGGRVAARRGDKFGVAQLLAVELAEAVDGAPEQLGRAVLAVPALVGRQVAQAEVGGEVDDERAEAAQRRDRRRRGAVRVGDDRRVDLLDLVEVELAQLERHPVARVEAVEPLAGVAARGDRDQLQLRVAPDDLRRQGAGEAGGAGNQHPRRGVAVEWLCEPISHAATPRSLPARPRSRRAAG